ncbi:septum formation initiator family protein [Geobacter hydrogenophilus]|uniref:Septum formation initiator n=1 Tax=Geobacter hydrogenophilus TaxID=40983 RepID=A0A9W6G2D7_9BACT|nr:septum formation initiator family protein [Geobacter hydrogenophilus]MBT0892989.1 septum formation initiator family protein [Geobacter hydrogenophilus]GLI39175.1 septum formation initiator [Geobacter hydrogenophilus]
MRKRMYLIPAGCILFILFFTVFGERGLLRIYHLSREKQEIAQKVTEVRGENEKLKREIEALKTDRRYLESIARKDFGLVRPNEVVYQFPSSDKAQAKTQQPVSSAVEKKR